ncbi:hypothetical protein [Lichenicola sp.]|uniref:hypothetical protein n=1 Tax=Lichenicola sp. TaxID=2804529 RepID=UPI003B003638
MAIMQILRAVAAALGRLVTRTVAVSRWIGGRLVLTCETVVERAVDVAASALDVGATACRLGAGILFEVVTAPCQLLGTLARDRQQSTAPEAAASEAMQVAVAQQQRADTAEDARQVLTSLRRVAQARAAGQVPDPLHLGRLSQRLIEYVEGLDREECSALARRSTSELRVLVSGRSLRRDVRSQDQVAVPAPVVDLAETRTARRLAIQAAIRSGANRDRTVDDVLARVATV